MPKAARFWATDGFPKEAERQAEAFRGDYFRRLPEIDSDELQDSARSIEHLRNTLGIPHASLVIGGFSQGTIISVEFLLQTSQSCAGALLLSGSLMAQQRWQNAVADVSTPFLQTHGLNDDTLPFSGAKALYELLIDKGFRGTFAHFDGGHTIPQRQMDQAAELLARWYST